MTSSHSAQSAEFDPSLKWARFTSRMEESSKVTVRTGALSQFKRKKKYNVNVGFFLLELQVREGAFLPLFFLLTYCHYYCLYIY